MDDRISTLPDTVLCHILSFLPIEQVVATSVLSKRWSPLWLSVPTLNFDDFRYICDFDEFPNYEEFESESKENYPDFVRFVYAVILSRDFHQPIQTFRLRCTNSHYCDPININVWINAASRSRVENLDLCLLRFGICKPFLHSPSAIFNCTTLVVLKLKGLTVKPPSPVYFPSLKILRLISVRFLEHRHLSELLSGCPVLEDLEAMNLYLDNYLAVAEFKSLPKLVRAYVYKIHIPFETVKNVGFLRIKMDGAVNCMDKNPCVNDFIPVFHNLNHVELIYWNYTTKDWLEIIEILKHCPKLQILVIHQTSGFFDGHEEGEWPYPLSVPESISLNLKTCCLTNYRGSKGEIRFARYIMHNARLLRSMTISVSANTNLEERLEMIKKLSLCTRLSASCELAFKWIENGWDLSNWMYSFLMSSF